MMAPREVRRIRLKLRLTQEDAAMWLGGGPRAFVVPGHDSRLGQVINNLIDNARSFSPPGGAVRVTCRKLKG